MPVQPPPSVVKLQVWVNPAISFFTMGVNDAGIPVQVLVPLIYVTWIPK
jgi:hypothetical protein